ncbi:MAG TPA: glycosyltransferase family 39 protein [Candidatus Dormibacteraeota bacterium]|nr:glycosyltransferase family 39 protein [Candidatus Dormibacteraeota bacterium]
MAATTVPRWLAVPWRSPADQPWWARPALLGIAAMAAVLFAWNITTWGFAPFYSAAARSMSESWLAFFFGSVDPASSITIDKVPGFLWPQALSARIFGFHAWALTLPQVIEGVVTVLALFRVVRRWAGPAPGLLAAAIFALTPAIASLFGHAMEDGALAMCLVLAADAWQRAVEGARLRSLLLAGLWVGLGFQAKMLVAWVVLPAFAIVYLVAAPGPVARRLGHLALAGAFTLLVSASWMLLVTVVPAAARPYIDGSTSNSAFAMVLGYNGLSRFGVHLPGSIVPAFDLQGGDVTGTGKLLAGSLASQVGWLYPLAVLAFAFGIVWRRGTPRTDRLRAGLLMWGLWLAVAALALSFGVVLHTAYLAVLAPPIAALGGAGIVVLAQAHQAGGKRAWALPVTVASTVAWATFLSLQFPTFLSWLPPAVIATAGVGVLLMAVARLTEHARGRLAILGVAVAVAAMLGTPSAWAASVLDPQYSGSVIDASAGPVGGVGPVSPQTTAMVRNDLEHVGGSSTAFGSGPLPHPQREMLAYLEANRGEAKYLLASQSLHLGTLFIMVSGAPVLIMGGFSGLVPYPTPDQFRRMVATGQVRHVLLGSDLPPGLAPRVAQSTNSAIAVWVRANCVPVPPSTYGAQPPPGEEGAGQGDRGLYTCGR